ncbi:DUF3025 domain-containing protein [Rhodoferax sp.]|uniref:DUF3025 domain-containing protein n=1 Tax=Rhodoferax sp. TaxID=50421 RepID=UPI00276F63C1|nr:DUF3025 domain-containing protein [Rhodoferax sp.]
MAQGLETIDWSAPWLADWREPGLALAKLVQEQGLSCAAALNQSDHAQVRFVPQSSLPAGEAYEAFIFRTGRCPTRDGLHDFFNGLCWLRFPLVKRRLNQLHVAQIERTGIAPVRGPARDALTVFDENAAFLRAPDALWDALVNKDWQRVFGALRPLWRKAQLVLFGHALLEKLVHPRKSITAHVYRVHPATNSIADMDTWVAADLSAEKLASKPFAHLPVLGVPLWWQGNADLAFYADAAVFRPPK